MNFATGIYAMALRTGIDENTMKTYLLLFSKLILDPLNTNFVWDSWVKVSNFVKLMMRNTVIVFDIMGQLKRIGKPTEEQKIEE